LYLLKKWMHWKIGRKLIAAVAKCNCLQGAPIFMDAFPGVRCAPLEGASAAAVVADAVAVVDAGQSCCWASELRILIGENSIYIGNILDMKLPPTAHCSLPLCPVLWFSSDMLV
jgi:hypothetical protein